MDKSVSTHAGITSSRSTFSPDYHLLNHVTLRLEDGTTQIDHVLFPVLEYSSSRLKTTRAGSSLVRATAIGHRSCIARSLNSRTRYARITGMSCDSGAARFPACRCRSPGCRLYRPPYCLT